MSDERRGGFRGGRGGFRGGPREMEEVDVVFVTTISMIILMKEISGDVMLLGINVNAF